jgi:hypothetical protein
MRMTNGAVAVLTILSGETVLSFTGVPRNFAQRNRNANVSRMTAEIDVNLITRHQRIFNSVPPEIVM